MPAPTLTLSLDPEADALLSRDPLSLLIGMVLDQQVPLEKAFRGPYDLMRRLGEPAGSGGTAEPAGSGGTAEPAGSGGTAEPAGSGGTAEPAGSGGKAGRQRGKKLDAAALAEMDSEELVKMFVTPPALHRYPAAMAGRVQELCRIVASDYGGKADDIWKKAADGAELLARIKALPGFGEQKARIFVALLGKQLGVDVPGWREAAGTFGQEGSRMSVADITGPDSLAEVRAYKQQMKAAAKAVQGAKPSGAPRKAKA